MQTLVKLKRMKQSSKKGILKFIDSSSGCFPKPCAGGSCPSAPAKKCANHTVFRVVGFMFSVDILWQAPASFC